MAIPEKIPIIDNTINNQPIILKITKDVNILNYPPFLIVLKTDLNSQTLGKLKKSKIGTLNSLQ